jgi:hypothetical protein
MKSCFSPRRFRPTGGLQPRYGWSSGTVLTQIVETNPVELAGALARDAQPDETVPQRARSEAVVSRKRARGRMKSFSEGWKYWVTLNATDLTWTALVIGGVLFTTLLMRG